MESTVDHYPGEKLWELLFCASFTITDLQGDCNSSFPTRNLKFAYVYAVDNR